MQDLIIHNALLIDGDGGEDSARRGSLAVRDGQISAITEPGEVLTESAAQSIDADGLALMPGIIDSHTHYDAQVTWDASLSPSSTLGVSTVLIGNCGFTIAPCRPRDRDRVMRNLTQVEGMSIDVLRNGIDWQFESFPEYLDWLQARGALLNVGAFFGHSSLRTWTLGDAASERAATADELAEMRALTAAAMAAGAVGFASSTAAQHNGHGGVPMPSRLADRQEFDSLLGALGDSGRGTFMLTKGADTSIEQLEQLAAHSGRPVMIAALLHNPTVPEAIFDDLAAIAAARDRGRELYGQVSCCPLTNEFTLRSAYPFEGLDAWKPAMQVASDEPALMRLLSDPEFRQQVRAELARPLGGRLFNSEWHKLSIVTAARAENADLEGRSVAELAAAAGKEPLDWMLDFAISEQLQTLFIAVLLNSDEDAVARALTDPSASIALSDAGAHLTFFCDAGFGLHLLGHWSRDKQVLSLAQAVHQLTGRVADIYRIPRRGRLRTGYHADLLLFDPAKVGRGPARRVFDLPGGAPRLTTDGQGIHGLWVNGSRVADDNGLIEQAQLPGQLLREFDA